MKLSFEDPQPITRGARSGQFQELTQTCEALRSHKEKWCKVFERPIASRTYLHTLIRKAREKGYSDTDFEMTSRQINPKTCALFVRFVGKGKPGRKKASKP